MNVLKKPMTYRSAGVDIEAGDALVDHIRKRVPSIGDFAGLFPFPKGYRKPSLVGCADGVGTKLKIAQDLGVHDTVGIDLVAMNVNDLICCGAKPLFFPDYYAAGKLELDTAKKVMDGIIRGCQEAECMLLGGETAERECEKNTGARQHGALLYPGRCEMHYGVHATCRRR